MTTAFALPERLAAKTDPALIGDDDRHFAAIGARIGRATAEASDRLADVRRRPAGQGQEALDRDLEVHRLTGRIRTLQRYALDLCLGRFVPADGGAPVYVGRLGLADEDGARLLVDWRSPAAEPFFAATHGAPMGLASRRRYRWANGRVVDYWDEVFTEDGLDDPRERAALDDQSAFIASLGASRSPRMRDVLATIQSDQDAVIRAGSRGALVVDGGPGTGKTVVALHRAAYLLYTDPRLGDRRGGVLVVGPHRPYLDYVADVLPSLGEEGVATCTLRDLVPEGATAGIEPDPAVAALKSSARLVDAVEAAVRHHERPPTMEFVVETPWSDILVEPEDWAEAFAAPEPGTPHNLARDEVWEELLAILVDRDGGAAPTHLLHRALAGHDGLRAAFGRAWPVLDPVGVIADLWSVPTYLAACAPWLGADDVRMLRRDDPRAFTASDLPFLDAARRRIGDPEAPALARRREAEQAIEQRERERVVEDLVAADDSELLVMSILKGQDARNSLADDASTIADPDDLAGPFAHVIVDEAQELTDAEWRMLLARNPSRSFTVVGDRAQARHGFAGSWEERLARAGIDRVRIASLTVNYRTPAEIMEAAAPVILEAIPDANVPTSIRRSGIPVEYRPFAERDAIVDGWLAEHPDGEGVACVIGDATFAPRDRVRSLSPELAKGLEFDLVVLVDGGASPERGASVGPGASADLEAAVDRYVAMTRATRRLVVLTAA
ncbi:RNA polymerase recycling motor ATPase HelR [Agromyces sp. MMS24-JH15]|uniref:RNA polymerase recycling motor ATPase HelR n=1 Tax=Agromyces sp. MMS24-JH15 TaxID=3243765 RepID=UPI00374A2E99